MYGNCPASGQGGMNDESKKRVEHTTNEHDSFEELDEEGEDREDDGKGRGAMLLVSAFRRFKPDRERSTPLSRQVMEKTYN